jgi:hypothetical protein
MHHVILVSSKNVWNLIFEQKTPRPMEEIRPLIATFSFLCFFFASLFLKHNRRVQFSQFCAREIEPKNPNIQVLDSLH